MPEVTLTSSKIAQVMLSITYGLSLFSIGHIVVLPWEGSDSKPEKLRQTYRLLVQQIDDLSMNYLNTLPADRPLSDNEKDAVHAWLKYDKQFVELLENSPMQSFECATAARRVGFASAILGDTQTAEEHLNISIDKFSWLQTEYQAGVSYRFEEAAVRLQLATLFQHMHRREAAINQLDLAIAALDVEHLPRNGEFVIQAARTTVQAARQLIAIGEKGKAALLLKSNGQQLESLRASQVAPAEALDRLIEETGQLQTKISNE